jgi:hypothetical protein
MVAQIPTFRTFLLSSDPAEGALGAESTLFSMGFIETSALAASVNDASLPPGDVDALSCASGALAPEALSPASAQEEAKKRRHKRTMGRTKK